MAEAVISHVQPMQKQISELLDNPGFLLQILKSGAEKAEEISEKTLQEVKEKLGMEFSSKAVYKTKLNL